MSEKIKIQNMRIAWKSSEGSSGRKSWGPRSSCSLSVVQKACVIFECLNVRELSRSSEVKLTLHLALVRLLLEYYLVLVSMLQMDIDELEGIQTRAT